MEDHQRRLGVARNVTSSNWVCQDYALVSQGRGVASDVSDLLISFYNIHQRLKIRVSGVQFPPCLIPNLGSKIPKMGIKKRKPRNRTPVGSSVADALFTKVQQRVLA